MAKKTGGPAEAVVAGGVHGEPPRFLASVEIYNFESKTWRYIVIYYTVNGLCVFLLFVRHGEENWWPR